MRIVESDETEGRIFWLPVGGRAVLVNSGADYPASANWYIEGCPRDLDTRVDANWFNVASELNAVNEQPWTPGGVWLRVRARAATAAVGPRVDFSLAEGGVGLRDDLEPRRPNPPMDVRASAVADTTATVGWDAGPPVVNGDELTGFQYRTKIGSAAFGAWTDVTGGATAREQDLTGLTANRSTRVQVRAVTNRYDTDAGEVRFNTTA